MNCDWVQQNVCLYLYNELADDARHELEQHIQRCKACAGRAGRAAGISGADECAAGGRAFRQLSGGRAHAAAGGAGNHRAASRLVSPFRFRSHRVVAAGAFLAGAGRGSADRRLRLRTGNDVQRVGHGKAGTTSTTSGSKSSIGGITSIDHKPNSNHVQDPLPAHRARLGGRFDQRSQDSGAADVRGQEQLQQFRRAA